MKLLLTIMMTLFSLSLFAQAASVTPSASNKENLHIKIEGKTAQYIFEQMKIRSELEQYPGFNLTHTYKRNSQFSCRVERVITVTVPATKDKYLCILLIDKKGNILDLTEL